MSCRSYCFSLVQYFCTGWKGLKISCKPEERKQKGQMALPFKSVAEKLHLKGVKRFAVRPKGNPSPTLTHHIPSSSSSSLVTMGKKTGSVSSSSTGGSFALHRDLSVRSEPRNEPPPSNESQHPHLSASTAPRRTSYAGETHIARKGTVEAADRSPWNSSFFKTCVFPPVF